MAQRALRPLRAENQSICIRFLRSVPLVDKTVTSLWFVKHQALDPIYWHVITFLAKTNHRQNHLQICLGLDPVPGCHRFLSCSLSESTCLLVLQSHLWRISMIPGLSPKKSRCDAIPHRWLWPSFSFHEIKPIQQVTELPGSVSLEVNS